MRRRHQLPARSPACGKNSVPRVRRRKILDITRVNRDSNRGFMGFLTSILRALAPLALEHGTPMLRDWWKARTGQPRIEPLQQLTSDIAQLKAHAEQVDLILEGLNTNLEKLNHGFTAR